MAAKAASTARSTSKAPTVDDLEVMLNNTLNQCNQLAKSDDVTADIAAAKMLNYCIRMLHSEGWVSFVCLSWF